MAPFKLKFRMGSSSRSTSQEADQPAVVQPLLSSTTTSIGASNTTIDSEFNSLTSLNNDQRNLLPTNTHTFEERTGYTNPIIMQNIIDTQTSLPSTSSTNEYHSNQNIENVNNSTNEFHCGNGNNNNNKTTNEITTTTTTIAATTVGTQLFLSQQNESNENLLETTTGSCDPLFSTQSLDQINLEEEDGDEEQCQMITNEDDDLPDDCSSNLENNSEDEDWNSNDLQHMHQQIQQTTLDTIINNKSSKKIYKEFSKQWGITCKMSETCRCMECQGHYFDCDFDDNDHQKTDGGLGAGTPMFISEVMHGSACTII